MYRFLFRPLWIGFHLLVLGAVVLMVNLGFWQLRRLDERQQFNDKVEERIAEPAVPVEELLGDPGLDPDAAEWRTVSATGTYLPDQVLVFNRSQNGVAGDNVLTPLVLGDGTVLLVNRGFVRLAVDTPAPPAGEVNVLGLVRPSEERRRGQLTDSNEGAITEVRRVDIDRIAPQLPGEVAPFYVDLRESAPPIGDGDPLPVPLPELDSGPHLSYAIQWFIFSLAVVVGWVLAVRRSIGTHRRAAAKLTDGAGGPDEPDSRPPAAAGAPTAPTGTAASSPD